MRIVESFAEARRIRPGSVGLVPTMGFLHEGHLSLARAARGANDTVLMSLFVNPLQFGEDEDLSGYPRDFERDAELAAANGVDVLFAPSVEEVYPRNPVTKVIVGGLVDTLEGASRPGHFAGVAVVVAKLLAGLRPTRAYFGRKDAQQLAVVRRMAEDLSFPVEIVGCPIVREPSGLALSSRNSYLSPAQREAATALSRGLMSAAGAAEAGETVGAELERIAQRAMEGAAGVDPEYAALASADDIARLDRLDRPGFLDRKSVV